ncbi:MAG: MMPL family transporter [Erythrobacter sp.]
MKTALVNFLVDRRGWLAACGLLLAIMLTAGLAQIVLDNRERSFFPDDDPIIERTDWLSERMGSSKNAMLLLYQPSDGDVLSPFSLSQLRTVADEATLLPHVTDTHSLFDDSKTVVVREKPDAKEQLAVVSILQGADLFSDEGIEALRRDLSAARTVAGRSVGRDFQSAVVTIQFELEDPAEDDGLSRNERIDLLIAKVDEIEALLIESEPEARLLLVGSSLFEHASTQVLKEDVRMLFPIFAILYLTLLLAFYRSVIFALGACLFVAMVIGATAGAVGWLGLAFSTLSASALLLVGTLAVADLVHVANCYFPDKETPFNAEAVKRAIDRHLVPITATTISTLIGASALFFSPAEPIRVFATVILIGVVLAFVFTLLLVPVLLAVCQRRMLPIHRMLVEALLGLSRKARARPALSLGVTGSVMLFGAVGITQMKVDDNLASWFDPSTEFRQGMDLLDANYLSLRTITAATKVEDADRNAALNSRGAVELGYFGILQSDLSQATEGQWLSVATAQESWRARLNEGDTQTSFRPDRMALPVELEQPSTRTLADSGLMTRLEPGVADWSVAYFDPDRATTFELLQQVEAINAALDGSQHGARETRLQGIPLAFAQTSAANFAGIATGSVLAILLVSLAMFGAFGSARLAAISLVPNFAPLIVIYGAWGWLTGALNMAAVGVFATAFGIIVDDTIHIITAFKREINLGADCDAAIDVAIRHSGSAVLITTLLLTTGFLLLSLSDFTLTAQKAGMVGCALIFALIFDIAILPLLLKMFGRNRKSRVHRY